MKHKIIIHFYCVIFLFFILGANAQTYRVSGYVKDGQSKEVLIGASVYDTATLKGSSTNSDGYFSFYLPSNKTRLGFSYMGYYPKSISLSLHKDTVITVYLGSKVNEMDEVLVLSDMRNINLQLGKTHVPAHFIKSLPSFMGEADLMKAITYIPGVAMGREGYSGIYVRGGDRGQNLILLDGIKLYNTSHAGGFVSLFSPNILKHVDIYKGGFPARYGGRTSSVVDVYSRDGSRDRLRAKFSLGIIASSLLVEGPISDKISFLISGRTSYLGLFQGETEEIGFTQSSKFTFFDVNSKITWYKTDKNKFFFTLYSSHDVEKNKTEGKYGTLYENSYGMRVKNTGMALGQTYLLSNKMFMKNTLSFTNYDISRSNKNMMKNNGIISTYNFVSASGIRDFTAHSQIEWNVYENHLLKFGAELSYYYVQPSISTTYSTKSFEIPVDTTMGVKNRLNAFETVLFVEEQWQIAPKLLANIGLRMNYYYGEETGYFRPEPRIAMSWNFHENMALKANYTIMNQFTHVIVSHSAGFDDEIWLVSNKKFAPQRSQQASLGIFWVSTKWNMEVSAEGYYKNMKNLLQYSTSANIANSLDVQDLISNKGIGKSYGGETQITFDFGRYKTSLGYALSWNFRKFSDINSGEWFPFMYDRRHDLSWINTIQLGKRYSISTNFVLASGTPITLPEGFVQDDENFYGYFIYSGINNRRLPLYHRLDLSVVRKTKLKWGNNVQLELNIFNVYARQNPSYISYRFSNGKVIQKAMFSIIPSLSISIDF